MVTHTQPYYSANF